MHPAPDGQEVLKRRLRAVLIVLSLLVPAFCVLGGLALLVASQQPGVIAYVLLVPWVLIGAAIGLLAWRAQRTLSQLATEREAQAHSDPNKP